MELINKIGRRKAAVARVYLKKGTGKIEINGKDLAEYFPMTDTQVKVTDPLTVTGQANAFDIKVNVAGGGFKGQAEAIRMAISRALVEADENNKKSLKERKFLTRDPREVERKKFGKPKARRSFQFSKR